jgi:hypothetical protein
MLLNQTWLIICTNLFILNTDRLSITVFNMFTTIYILQKRMIELLSNDSATMSSITEGMIRWAPDDAYALAMDKKPKYDGQGLEVGFNELKAPPLNIICLQHAHKRLYSWWWMNKNN